MALINLDDQVLQIAPQVCKEGAKWQIEEQFVHKGVIQLENCQDDDPCRIAHHSLIVVEEFARDGQQWEVVRARIDEELDRG